MVNLETTTGIISDVFDKYHSSYMKFEQTVNQHIVDKIYEVAGNGVKVDTKEDIDRLQEDYCMYLIVIDLDTNNVNSPTGSLGFKKGFEFFIEEPEPNERGVHIMRCGAMLKKDKQGKWSVI